MAKSLVCLCVTGKTLAEDVAIVEKYKEFIDVVELRVDFLEENERLKIREFPSMIDVPAILTIRRKIDGGKFVEGESARTILFARALSFADEDKTKNFAYVDFEEDFHISSLEDATLAFETKVILIFPKKRSQYFGFKRKPKSRMSQIGEYTTCVIIFVIFVCRLMLSVPAQRKKSLPNNLAFIIIVVTDKPHAIFQGTVNVIISKVALHFAQHHRVR